MATRRLTRRFFQIPETSKALLRNSDSAGEPNPRPGGPHRRGQVRAAETRLLYENANLGLVVTIVIALLLAYAQWSLISHSVIAAWLLYMLLVCAARFLLVRRYQRAPAHDTSDGWNTAFVGGTAFAAAGWAMAAIL